MVPAAGLWRNARFLARPVVGAAAFSRRGLATAPSVKASTYDRQSYEHAYAVTPYRQMAGATEQQRAAWATRDELLHAKMREHVPAALAHNGEETFDDHLVGLELGLGSGLRLGFGLGLQR